MATRKEEPNKSIAKCLSEISLTMTTKEVSELFGVPISTVRYWCSIGYLISQQRNDGATWLISSSDVKRKLQQKKSQ